MEPHVTQLSFGLFDGLAHLDMLASVTKRFGKINGVKTVFVRKKDSIYWGRRACLLDGVMARKNGDLEYNDEREKVDRDHGTRRGYLGPSSMRQGSCEKCI
jgi:hypothetical protein